MDLIEFVYVAAGIVLPLYYVPQIRRCLVDQTQLASYSMSKCAVQVALRLLMLPFIIGVGNATMVTIVGLDLLGRLGELASALVSLRRQRITWSAIAGRALRALPVPSMASRDAQAPIGRSGGAEY